MQNLTASAVISFSEALEDQAAEFYTRLSKVAEGERELFLKFAKESGKNKVRIVRTYQETISDALEACFAFEGLNLSDYKVSTDLPAGASQADLLKTALDLETNAITFYLTAAERSKALMATIPGAFKGVARRRSKRKAELESMLAAT